MPVPVRMEAVLTRDTYVKRTGRVPWFFMSNIVAWGSPHIINTALMNILDMAGGMRYNNLPSGKDYSHMLVNCE